MELSLAPMLNVTTPQFRALMRIVSPDVYLFTEMISPEFILNNTNYLDRVGSYDPLTIIQIGGSDPKRIGQAILKVVNETKFRMFNLNVGCPSQKVVNGRFGASLMLNTQLVVDIINHVYDKTNIVMSIKCRTGVDSHDSFVFFYNFISNIAKNTKCRVFYVHARKCWLKGLSPKENRHIPPLNYEYVTMLKQLMPHLKIHINGSVRDVADFKELDGVMIGRAAIRNIVIFEEIKKKISASLDRCSACTNGVLARWTKVEGITINVICEYFKLLSINKKNVNKCIGSPENQLLKHSHGCDVLIHQIVNKYFNKYNQSNIAKFYDIAPLLNLFRGKNGSKHFKQLLNRLIAEKKTIGYCCNKITQHISLFLFEQKIKSST